MGTIEETAVSNDLMERLSYMTDELERLINLSRGEQMGGRRFSVKEIRESSAGVSKARPSLTLYRMIRLGVLNNLSGARISYRAGNEIGKGFAPRTIDDMASLTESLGLGRLQVEEHVDDSATLHLADCNACVGLSRGDDPVCHFEAGLLAGMLETVKGQEFDVHERRCTVTGWEHCVFEAKSARAGGLEEMAERIALDYSAENIKLLSTLASHAMSALENAILYEKTKRLVMVDSLTYTYNRRYFEERLREEYNRAKRHTLPLSLLMIDIDKFKSHNDTYGHPHGDRVLRTLARVVRDSIRGIDLVARYGGDEFMVILPQTDEAGLQVVAERIRRRVEEQKLIESETRKEVAFTVSVGASSYPQNAANPEDLVNQSDQALYRAKQLGGNRACMFVLREVK